VVFSFTELRKALQKQEEEKKQCEKNIDDLQEKNESLKNDLTKAEKERKELSHKVGACLWLGYGVDSVGTGLVEGTCTIKGPYTGETRPPYILFLFSNFVCMTESFILQ